jgi:hypothetical protein
MTLAFVENQPIQERSVYVFESFQAIDDRFDLFWRCFSPEAMYSNAPATSLLESRKAPAPPKLATRVTNYPAPADRNIIVNELGYVVELVWDETNSHDDDEYFLRKCYVASEASQSNITLAKKLVEHRHSTDELYVAKALHTNEMPAVFEDDSPEKPIVILGGIGHGKSTFLKHFRHIAAKEALKRYIQLDVNFVDRPDSRSEVGRYIVQEIDRQLLSAYGVDINEDSFVRAALRSELQRFKKTPQAKAYEADEKGYRTAELGRINIIQENQHEYLRHVFQHLKHARNISVAIFLDNLDRRDDPIQEEAFLRASAMSRDWACLVFVCLRPSTFYRSKESGVLDSVAPKVIAIASPKTGVLLKKRFLYAQDLANGELPPGTAAARSPLGREITVHLPRVAEFLGCCAESFFRDRDLSMVFEAASNGNVRDLLRYVRQMITSKHLNTDKILEEIPNGYRIPDFEAIRALIFGDYMHYDPTRSIFVNVFDTIHADRSENFSRFLVMHYLNRVAPGSPTFGFCPVATVQQYLCQLGYSADHAIQTLQFLYEKNCVESRVLGLPWTRGIVDLRVTTLGRYHVNQLVRTFMYVDAVVIDTPILDSTIRTSIEDVQDIFGRVQRAVDFVEYLNACANSLRDADSNRLWSDTYADLQKSIREVQTSANKWQLKRTGGALR